MMRPGAMRAFMVKEIRHILRDRQTLTILLLLPLAMVVLFGYALRSDVKDVRIAFVDPMPDDATGAIRNRFAGSARFQVVDVVPTVAAVEPLFRRGAADVALVFEPDLAGRLSRGSPAQLLLIGDVSDPNTGTTIQAYASAILADYQRDLSTARSGMRIEMRTRMRYNPTLESVNLFVPGLIALVLTLVSALMTAISLSKEKERGTLEVLLVSPLRPWQIILGKVLPYLLLAFVNVVTALLAAWAVFQVPFRGSLALLLVASMLYSMVSLALGVLVAAITTSQRAAMIGAMAGTMLPNELLSGMIFPIASLPDWLQWVTIVIPARWYIVISRGIMLKGAGIEHLWSEMLVLVAMLAGFLLLAVRSFSSRLD